MQCQLPGGGGRGEAAGAAAPPDFRNLCSKSPNHVVYSPTIAPPAPQSWRPPCTLQLVDFSFMIKSQIKAGPE